MFTRVTSQLLKRGLQGALLGLLLLAAVYVSMGRILIANIDRYQVEIERQLTGLLKQPVSVEKLEGSFRYLDPILAIHGLSIGEYSAVDSDFIGVRLDLIASLMQRRIVVEDVVVNGLALNLIQGEKGWQVEGIPLGKRNIELDLLLDILANLDEIRFTRVNIGINTDSVSYSLRSDEDQAFELSRQGEVMLVSWVLQLVNNNKAAETAEFKLVGHYTGDPRREDFSAALYLNLPKVDLAGLLPASMSSNRLVGFAVDGEYWLDADQGEILVRGRSKIHELKIAKVNKAGPDKQQAVIVSDDLSLELGLRHDYKEGTSISLNNIRGHWFDNAIEIDDINLVFDHAELSGPAALSMAITLPDIDLQRLSRASIETGVKLADINPELESSLNKLAITGRITAPSIVMEFGAAEPRYELVAGLEALHLGPDTAVPAISQLDGLLVLNNGGGYFDVNMEQAFNIEYGVLFPEPWFFDRANFRTHFIQSEIGMHIVSDLVSLSRGELKANGKFTINMHKDVSKRTWGLEIGIQNAGLLDAQRYLPYTMSPALTGWLGEAILGGVAKQGGLVFHGPLGKNTIKAQKVFDIYFKVEDTILDYDVRWPRIDGLAATIYIGNKQVYSDDATGRLFDSRLLKSEVIVPITAAGVDTILINGQLEGRFSDGLKLLSDTPLSAATNALFNDWQGEGLMSGGVRLNIPLGRRKLEPPWVDVNVSLKNTDVFMPQYNIKVDQLNGKFHYESLSGISAKTFTAQLFDQAVSGRIETVAAGKATDINIYVDGAVDVADLHAWSEQSLLTQMSGLMPYKTQLTIPQGGRPGQAISIEARSNMQGVAITLPQPLSKPAEQTVELRYRQAFMDYGHKVELNVEHRVQSAFKISDGLLTGGRVHFGDSAMGVVLFDKIRVSGHFDKLVYAEWQDLTLALQGKSEVSIENELISKLAAIDVTAADLDVLGLEIDDADLSISRSETAWQVDIVSPMLAGHVMVDDDELKPMAVNLQYLHLASQEEGQNDKPAGEDVLAGLRPSEILAFGLDVDSVLLDGEDYGDWHFDYEPNDLSSDDLSPHEQSGTINIRSANVKGLYLPPDGQITWRYADGKHRSEFEGDLLIDDVAASLQQWGFASSIEGEEFEFFVKLNWPGSPAMIDVDVVKGLIEQRSGQGRFVQAQANVGALKLVGIFDFASLMRRFRLDFSDVIDEGFVFHEMHGSIRMNQGVIDIVDPVYIEGSGSIFKLGGWVDLDTGILDNDMIVTLPLNRNLPWWAAYSAYAVSPLTGAAVFLGQKLFKKQIDAITSVKYKITGTLDEPDVAFVSIFNTSVREAPAEVSAASEVTPP